MKIHASVDLAELVPLMAVARTVDSNAALRLAPRLKRIIGRKRHRWLES